MLANCISLATGFTEHDLATNRVIVLETRIHEAVVAYFGTILGRTKKNHEQMLVMAAGLRRPKA